MAKTKVAILGGGLGSIAAAYELSCTEALRDRYEITVYQQAFRLGGKGASGRNAALGQRIEEHGLHAFLGFYENAFRLMRDLYADYAALRPDAKWKSYRDAFEPQRQVTLEEWVPKRGGRPEEGRFATWNIVMPWLPGEPGDGEPVPLVAKLVVGGVQLLLELLRDLLHREPRAFGVLARDLVLLQPTVLRDALTGDVAGALDSIMRTLARHEDDDSLDDDVRRLVLASLLGSAILRGLATEVLPRGETEGFAYIDQWDFKTWLERHGASPRVSFWGPVRALYDLGFAYVEGKGDREHAQAAAGVCLRILLLLGLGYKDAPLWKMKAGMGDVIFAPAYEVLSARGVRFEFFARVTDVGLSDTGTLVDRITISDQVALVSGAYEPLVHVNGLPCWPHEPLWDQIVDGAAVKARLDAEGLTLESAWCQESVGTRTLRLGVDFDQVVMGISVGALPYVAPALVAGREDWRRMIATTKTVQTQAAQLWLDRDTRGLGWRSGPTIMTGYVEPFDTWGDMSHLLPEEAWPAPEPKSIAYFCNAFPDAEVIPPFTDPTFPKREAERVFAFTRRYLETHIGHLWPEATRPGEPDALDYALLHDPSGGVGEARLRAQYVRANIDPTERYVLSVPGSTQLRLWAGRSGYMNLFLAGDWVMTSINGGCAEGAIEGGLRAAHAMIGSSPRPFTDRHVRDDVTPARGD